MSKKSTSYARQARRRSDRSNSTTTPPTGAGPGDASFLETFDNSMRPIWTGIFEKLVNMERPEKITPLDFYLSASRAAAMALGMAAELEAVQVQKLEAMTPAQGNLMLTMLREVVLGGFSHGMHLGRKMHSEGPPSRLIVPSQRAAKLIVPGQ